ncbi:MAG TPA: tetratricopeptide repeat protein [Terriglobales bacterium]|nr:tetratricopeptide repeat protein [Terriglobales bacterium]
MSFLFFLFIFPCGVKAVAQGSAKVNDLEALAARQRTAVAANPDSAELHGELGRTLLKQGKYEEATGELGVAVNQLTDSRIYNMALVEALLGWEHWGVAVDFLNAVRDRFQQFAEFHYYLGLANFKLNKTPDAVPEFEEALRINPSLDLAKFGLAACRAAAGDLQGAATLSRQLVTEHPRNARYWLALAQVLDSMGDGERPEALRASRRALALRPGDPVMELKTAVILAKLTRYAAARPLLEHVVKVDPKNSQARVALANAYTHLGQRELAKKQSEVVVELEKAKTTPQ